MEIYQLRAFLTVARLGHLTRAAERLHISQSAVSKQIKELEDELGVILFDRPSSGTSLTRSGQTAAGASRKNPGQRARTDQYGQGNPRRDCRHDQTGHHHRLLREDIAREAEQKSQLVLWEGASRPCPLSFIYPKAKADDVLVNALHKVALEAWTL